MSEVKFANQSGEGSRRRGLALPFWIFMLLAVVAAGGVGVVLKQQEQRVLGAMITSEGERQLDLLIAASLDDILSEDVPRLETILELVMENIPDVYSLRITDEDDKVLVEQKRAANQFSAAAAGGPGVSPLQRLVKPVRFEGETYGRMTIEWNPSHARTQMERHAYMLASAAAAVCLLFGLLGFWFGRARP